MRGRVENRRALPSLGSAARGLFAQSRARRAGSDGRMGVSCSWEGAEACRQVGGNGEDGSN